MAVKFKVGDIIRRNRPISINHGKKAVVQSVVPASEVGDILYGILIDSGQGASWYGKYCELVKKEEKDMDLEMATEFKVGDRIRRNDLTSFNHGLETIVTSTSMKNNSKYLTAKTANGKDVFWHKRYCELVKKEEKQEDLCRCDLQILMKRGCQCGCKI